MKELKDFITALSSWGKLGYKISITTLYGKDAVRCEKIHDGKIVVCEQIIDHEDLHLKYERLFAFMVRFIDKKIESGDF
jgi:hypothetical protein